jgi:hypothetical protein
VGGRVVSPETITLCLELLAQVSVPPTVPDAVDKMQRLVDARQELLAALPE